MTAAVTIKNKHGKTKYKNGGDTAKRKKSKRLGKVGRLVKKSKG
jgi:hypothetical protein